MLCCVVACCNVFVVRYSVWVVWVVCLGFVAHPTVFVTHLGVCGMCVCVYVCMFVCLCVCMYVSLFVCLFACLYACIYVLCKYVCMYV